MYDIQLSERNIVIEKSKHLAQIGVFLQQNNSQTNAPRGLWTNARVVTSADLRIGSYRRNVY